MATTKIITEVTDLNATSSTNGLKMPTGTAYSGTPTDGMMRNDTTGSSQGSASTMQHYNGTEWKNFENLPNTFTADYLVIAGGGGGGAQYGGGGGAGGLRTSYGATSGGGGSAESSLSLTTLTNYTVTVGPGGGSISNNLVQAGNGTSSVFSTITSIGGGAGGNAGGSTTLVNGASGGSGGGQGNNGTAGSGVAGQGFAGGSGTGTGGGGGGAASAGSFLAAVDTPGGAGLSVSITGASILYSKGGVGVASSAINGGNNTGNGGDGTYNYYPSGSGGSGIVILRYPTANVSSYAVTGTLDTTTDTAYPVANSAYYKFEGNVDDSTTNGYNGTWTGTAAYGVGRFDDAAVFNGVNQTYVKLPSAVDTILNTKNFGLSLWVKAPNATTDAAFSTQTTNSTFQIHANWAIANRYALINGGGSNIDLGPIDSSWHHIVVTSDGSSSYKGYFDGVYKGASAYRQIGNTNDTFLGAHPGGNFALNGQIDQVRIFNSQLNQTQITQLYNEATVNESTDGTDSILQFIGGTGTVTFS